jgi:hypothetical protein
MYIGWLEVPHLDGRGGTVVVAFREVVGTLVVGALVVVPTFVVTAGFVVTVAGFVVDIAMEQEHGVNDP